MKPGKRVKGQTKPVSVLGEGRNLKQFPPGTQTGPTPEQKKTRKEQQLGTHPNDQKRKELTN